MERRIFPRSLAIIIATFATVWTLTLWQWRASHRVPNEIDIALYLLVLPLALVLSYRLLHAAIDGGKRLAQRQAEAAPADADAVNLKTPEPTIVRRDIAILGAYVLFSSGDQLPLLIDAAREKRRAGLCPRWRDDSGAQVFTAPVNTLDLAAFDPSLPEALCRWAEADRRTLWLAEAAASHTLNDAEALRYTSPPPVTSPATQSPQADAVLQLEWLLPARWRSEQLQPAQSWLTERLESSGWPASALRITATIIDDELTIWRRLEALGADFEINPQQPPRLLLASDSQLDDAHLHRWQIDQQLHGARQPEGRVPGEGASAVWLGAPRSQPQASTLAILHAPVFGQLTRAPSASGRVQNDVVRSMLEQAWAQAPTLLATSAAHLVSDTDVRPSRYAEALQIAEYAAPDHDADTALLPLACANGDCGAALTLATVAAAAWQAAETQDHCVLLSHRAPLARVIALVTPPPDSEPVPDTQGAPSLLG